MSDTRLIRISSRATGERRHVRVYIYPTLDDMRAASDRFNGNDHSTAGGTTQAYLDDDGRTSVPIIRLAATHLGSTIVCHEVHHAATGIYGSTLGPDAQLGEVLFFNNEPFAYLYSDLFAGLVSALWRHGYYQ